MERAVTRRACPTLMVLLLTSLIASGAWAQADAPETTPSDTPGADVEPASADVAQDESESESADATADEAGERDVAGESAAEESSTGAIMQRSAMPEDAVPTRIEERRSLPEGEATLPALPIAGGARFGPVAQAVSATAATPRSERTAPRRDPRRLRNAGWATFLSFYSVCLINGVVEMVVWGSGFGASSFIPFAGGMSSIFSGTHMMVLGPISTLGQITGFVTAMVGHGLERRARRARSARRPFRLSSLAVAPTGPTGEVGLTVSGLF